MSIYLSPAARPPAISVFDKQMGRANLSLGHAGNSAGAGAGAMVSGHVVLELLSVGTLWRFPSRDLVGRVEVVGQVLGVGMANFPVRRKTGITLERQERDC